MALYDKVTEDLEKDFIKDLTKGYKESLANIQKEMDIVYRKYSVDGILSMSEMAKYDRLASLEKKIAAELTSLNRGTYSQHKGYLTNVFTENYYITGYFLESDTAKDITYSLLNRQAIYESVLTPMDKIALENNATNVRANIKRSITQSIVQGQGASDMAKGITKALETNLNNAVKIARTETTGIMNKARVESMAHAESKGFVIRKKWITGKDDRVRNSHAMLEGEIVNLDKAFSNGLMYPGDQSGSAADVINCRCSSIEVVVKVNDKAKDVKVYGRKGAKGYEEWTQNRLKK